MSDFRVSGWLGQIRRLLVRGDDGLSDRELLQRFVASQDESAFAALLERHGPLVQRMCQRLVRDRHVAEDAFQATFLVLARKAGSVRRPEALGCWLHGVAYRVATRARRHGVPTPVDGPPALDRAPDALTEITLREARAMLHEALERLPEKYRLPLILCYLEEQTRDEAARQLGWPEGTFKRRLERGRELLRQQLGKHGLSISAGLLTAVLTADFAHALPPVLKQLTLESAVSVAAGKALAGVANEQTARLAESVLAAMGPSKLKLVVALGMTLIAVGTVAGGMYLQSHGVEAVAEQPVAGAGEVTAVEEPAPAEPPTPLDPPNDPLPDGAVARMGTARLRQGGSLSALAFSADGKRIATAGGTKQPIRFWDLATGKELQRCGGQADRITHLLASSDGKFLLSAELDNNFKNHSIRQWDVATGKKINQFTQDFQPQTMVLSGDNRYVAVGGLTGEIQVYDLVADTEKLRWKERGAYVAALAFSPDGKYLVTGGPKFNDDNKIRIWDVTAGKLVRDFAGPESGIGCCTFSPDGKLLATGGNRDGLIQVWDVDSGKVVRRCTGHEGELFTVRFRDAQTLVSGSYDNTIRRWDVATGKQTHRFAVRTSKAIGTAMALSPAGNLLAVSIGNPTFQLWNVVSGKEVASFAGHRNSVTALAFGADGKGLVSAGKDGAAKVWDIATARIAQASHADGEMHGHALSADGALVATADDKGVRVLETASGKKRYGFALAEARLEDLLTFTGDGKTLACTDCWGPIQVHDLISGKEARRIAEYPGQLPGRFGPVPRCPFSTIAISPDGRILATGEAPYLTQATQVYDTKIRLWDAVSGKELRQCEQKNGIVAVLFAADGRSVISVGHEDTAICVWETATGKLRYRCKAPKVKGPSFFIAMGAVALSPDGRTLAWGEETGRVGLFDMIAAKEVRTFQGHSGPITSLGFSADGNRLASGSYDTTILIWDVTARIPTAQPSAALSPDQLAVLWADLLGDDAAKAWHAMTSMTQAVPRPVPFLQQHLKPEAGLDLKQVAQHLANLQSNEFAARQQAETALEKLGDMVEPDLKNLLQGKPSLDTTQRVDRLLSKVAAQVWPAETLRAIRAVEVLEYIGTAEARQELERLARGGERAPLTRGAKAALERLSNR